MDKPMPRYLTRALPVREAEHRKDNMKGVQA